MTSLHVAPEMSSFEVRDYAAQDEDRVVRFIRQVLGEGGSVPRTPSFWRWKHMENPFGSSRILLAVNEEILGLRALLRWGFRTPHGYLKAVRAVDTSTHPGYRRLGIFSRLTKSALDRVKSEGTHIVFNTPNAQSMAGYLKMGWQSVGRPRLLLKPLRPVSIAVALMSRRQVRLAPPDVSGFFRSTPQSIGALLEYGESLHELLEHNDRLLATGIRTNRSVAFVRWRYAFAPQLHYFGHWGSNVGTGCLIYRPSIRRGMREIMLCEVLLGSDRPASLRTLIAGLARVVRGDYMVAAGTPGTSHWTLLRQAGFLPLPQRVGPNLIVHPLTWPRGELEPTRLASWRFSLGDLELF